MWKTQVALAAALIALSGCSVLQKQSASDSEQILEQAGFRREPSAQGAAGSSQQGTKVRQLSAASENGAPRYEFYDPDFCRCVYVGGAGEYAELQRLRAARVAEHNRALRAWNPSANSPDSAVWDAWMPEGLDLR
jgi:hypothetical protein